MTLGKADDRRLKTGVQRSGDRFCCTWMCNIILRARCTITVLVKPEQQITIHEHLNGSISLWLQEQSISFSLIESYVKPLPKSKPASKYYSQQQRRLAGKRGRKNSPLKN